MKTPSFAPTNRQEMETWGWKELDILLVSGDAYVDHPSFGVPLLAKLLIREGYRVGVLAQPLFPGCTGTRSQRRPPASEAECVADWQRMGAPRLFVGVSAGVVDSMLNHYTANKKTRSDDMYAPGGESGLRPDYATQVYCKLARKAFTVPVIVGGVEASLRRLAHYDYWQNKIRPSYLVDLDCDLLVYGMGERQSLAIARELKTSANAAEALARLRTERGMAYVTSKDEARKIEPRLTLPSYEEVREDKKTFARAAYLIEYECNPHHAKTLVQYHGSRAVVITPPALPLSTEELDAIYELPFCKDQHPSYKQKIPAAEMIRFSVAVNRGCFGGCSFCAITLHQGKIVQSRSEKSILSELEALQSVKGYTGQVSDLGGPTANMYGLRCKSPKVQGMCRKLSCLHPKICPHLVTDHAPQVELLRKARKVRGVKKITIQSGLRFDLALLAPDYIRELVHHHVGGHLKVAPEHMDAEILRLMKKPSFDEFCEFKKVFELESKAAGKEQYLVPYFISGFPGTTDEKMEKLHQWLKRENWKLQQVQGFIPTPMTLATAMYWSGIDPMSREKLNVARDPRDKKLQQALLQPHRPQNQRIVQAYQRRKRARDR